VKVGVLVTGDTAVRAAHSLSAQEGVASVVVIGPARSKSFDVVDNAAGCDVLVGSGPGAPALARKHGLPLVWDGDGPKRGVGVWGADPAGITISLGVVEPDPRLVAIAHPEISSNGGDRRVRFPSPVGLTMVRDTAVDGRPLAVGRSKNEYASSYVVAGNRTLTILEDAKFMAGVALAAGVSVLSDAARPVWDDAETYLSTVFAMGLVLGEA
jgi:hypothetical protein